MKTRSTNSTFKTLTAAFALLFAIATGLAGTTMFSPEIMAGETTLSRNTHDTNATPVASVVSEAVIHDDDGTPRPREDVIPITTTASTVADSQPRITSRYSDSSMVNFLSRGNMRQLTELYHEASRMIDARHVSPASYEDRSRAAINSLVAALDNTAFMRASNAQPNPQTVRTVQNELTQLARSQPARSANEAVGLMEWAAELVHRRLGIRKEAVALEFLNGTIDSLDRYSAFMPSMAGGASGANVEPVRTATLSENIVGIGVELKQHDNGALIVGVIDNSPAAELGLKEGDIIIAIGQQSMEGRNLNEIADRIGGRAGTSITLDIDRNGQKYRGTAVRRQFYVGSVNGTKMIDSQNNVGYVRLRQFSESSARDLEQALWSLHRQGMQALILDLRGNPGGLLDQAIMVTDMFVPRGTIVSTKGRTSSDNSNESARHEKTWSVPLVVLVDENSASASEILAAAVQENGRGVVVGRKSYGKGTVQTHFPLRTVSGNLKLTTANFYSPTGRQMAETGVTPNVEVNAQTTGYRGTDNDADVQAAMEVIRQGTPSRMVQLLAEGKTGEHLAQPASNSNSNTNFDFLNRLRQNIRGL